MKPLQAIFPAALAAALLLPCAALGAARPGGNVPLPAWQQPGESSSSSKSQEPDQSQTPDQNAGQQAKKGQKPASKGDAAQQPAASPDSDDAVSRRIKYTAQAEHDVEVGRYYEKRDKFDAAIDRYKEAAQLLPTYALPNRLMAEAYEKKHFLPEALQAYEKYLQVAPEAGDAGEIRKRADRLRKEIQEDERKREAATKPQ